MLALALCLALGVGLIFYALMSERGTHYVWQAATSLLGGRLTGTLDGGAIATGVRCATSTGKASTAMAPTSRSTASPAAGS